MLGKALARLQLGSAALYHERYIFRREELFATRPGLFFWQEYPWLLTSEATVSLSDQVQDVSFDLNWFAKTVPPVVPVFNPSILGGRGWLLATLRRANGAGCPQLESLNITSDRTGHHANDILLAMLDPSSWALRAVTIVESPEVSVPWTNDGQYRSISGLADARIFAAADESLWLLMFGEEIYEGISRQGLFIGRLRLQGPCAKVQPNLTDCDVLEARIEQTEFIRMPSGFHAVEKNWNIIRIMTSVGGNDYEMLIEYTVEPHIVVAAALGYTSGQLCLFSFNVVHSTRWGADIFSGLSDVRGSSCCAAVPQATVFGDILLGVGHVLLRRHASVAFDERSLQVRGTSVYWHFFYALRSRPPFDVVAVSLQWCAAPTGRYSLNLVDDTDVLCEAVQMVTGLHISSHADTMLGAQVLLAVGINDCEANVLKLRLIDVLAMLRPTTSSDVSFSDLAQLFAERRI